MEVKKHRECRLVRLTRLNPSCDYVPSFDTYFFEDVYLQMHLYLNTKVRFLILPFTETSSFSTQKFKPLNW